MVTVRPVRPDDKTAWLPLWQGYCVFYDVDIPDAVTEATWARFLDETAPIGCFVALSPEDQVIGFAAYVVHANTWSTKAVGYLEDLFVAEEWRGRGAARALIEAVADLGRKEGWLRVYWMTKAGNAPARTLYDKLAPVTDWVRYDLPLT